MEEDRLTLKERIEAAHDVYTLELLKDLIRTPSETPPGDVRAIIARLEREMKSLGFETQVLSRKPEKPNLIATKDFGGDGPTIVLYSHADCANIGDDNRGLWTADPHGAEIRDGNIYGNGAADAKSALASLIGACKILNDVRPSMQGKIIVMATADGEVGDTDGAKWMYENGLIPKADFGINGDASNLEVQHVFRGRLFYDIEVEGKVSHSNSPHLGINAISKMAQVIVALDNYKLKFTPHPSVPDSSKTITVINGGTKHNSLPGVCRAVLDARMVPGQTIASVTKELEDFLAGLMAKDPDLKVRIKLKEFGAREVCVVPADSPVVVETSRAFEEITGRKATHLSGPGSTGCVDYFVKLGIPSIFWGPANLYTAHQPDEHCPVDNLAVTTKVSALAIARLLKATEK